MSKPSFGPLPAIAATLGTYFVSQFAAALVLVGFFITGSQENPFIQFAYILMTAVFSFGFILIAMQAWDVSLPEVGVTRLKLGHIGGAFLGFGVYFLVYILIIILVGIVVPGLDTGQEQELGFSKEQAGYGLALVFISLVVIPPFVEEFVMRGFLYTGLRKQLTFRRATVITSILFAAAHLPGAKEGLLWVGAIDTFILSVVMCYLREHYKSLWPAVGVHMLKNGMAFSFLFIFKDVIR